MRDERNNMPIGWVDVQLKEIIPTSGVFCDGDWVESKDQDPNGDVRLIQLADIGDGKFIDKSDRYLTKDKAKELNCTFLETSDILIARMPDPLGRACIFPLQGHEKYVTVVDVCIIRVAVGFLAKKLLMYLINSPEIRSLIDAYKSGSTRKRVSRGNLAKVILPLPPLSEQNRIVAKIEELFSDLDAGIASLKTAQAQLKIYRQAVLKWAFEGKLTAEWRKEKQQKGELKSADELLAQIKAEREKRYNEQVKDWETAVKAWEAGGKVGKKPTKPKMLKEVEPLSEEAIAELPGLPEGWRLIKLGNIIDEPKYGTSKKCTYEIAGRGVLRIPNIQGGSIDKDDLKYAEFEDDEVITYELKEGDILTIRSNGSVSLVGKCALITKSDESLLFAGYLIRLRPNKALIYSKYLLNCFCSSLLRNQLESKAKSTSGVNNINSDELKQLTIPYCSNEEQEKVVQEIESRLSICDSLEAAIAENLQRAEALRQSILKHAFEGKLVPQDPNDEPAEKLLDRIKQEKKNPKHTKQLELLNLSNLEKNKT